MHDARENQIGRRDGRLNRIAKQVTQIKGIEARIGR
jgi:hypothetical protein